MTRSIGDKVSKNAGVCSDCEITMKTLDKFDKFIIIASDGIWDVISSQEAVEIVRKAYRLRKTEFACKCLVDEAIIRWKAQGDNTDDISVVIAFTQFND